MNSLHYQRQCDHKNPNENNSKFNLGFFEVYSVADSQVNLAKLVENFATNLLKLAHILQRDLIHKDLIRS